MSLSSLIQALRSEFYVARYALGARLLILLPSAAAAFQFIASKISDTGTAARNSLMNSNVLTMPSPITPGDILLMVLIPVSRCFSCCWLHKRHTASAPNWKAARCGIS